MSEFDVDRFVHQLTDEVWNRKMVGRLYERTTANVLVHHSSHEERYGRETLINDIIRELAAFPDMQVTMDKLLWQDEGGGTYLVSMQQTWSGHNTGYSIYGPPSGRHVTQSRLINGRITHGRVAELWIATNELDLIRQLDLDPALVLERMYAPPAPGKKERDDLLPFAGEFERDWSIEGQPPFHPETSPLSDAGELVLRSQHDIWNRRLIGTIDESYGAGYSGRWSIGRQLEDRAQLQALVLSYLAMFPDLAFRINHLIESSATEGSQRGVASFWTLLGTYAGPGCFGLAANQRVRASGISQYSLESGRIVAEHTEINEFRLWQQIAMFPSASSVPVEERNAGISEALPSLQ
jgi:predicted ester cyclase